MSMKDNVDYIKDEISTQESFIESFFKLEKFWKKYKKAIIALVATVIVAFGLNSIINYMAQQTKNEANIAFNKVLENPKDEKALATLKEKNKKLYEIALYLENKETKIDVEYLKEIVGYSKALKEENLAELNSMIQNPNFVQKDFAILNMAILQAKDKKYKEARESLKMISKDSSIANLANLLEHYLVTK